MRRPREYNQSPWGQIQHSRELLPGIYQVDTARHGGIMVWYRVARKLLSPEAQNAANVEHGWYCYEEDCDAQIVEKELLEQCLITAPKYWRGTPEEYRACIEDSVKRWHPEYWEVHEAKKAIEKPANDIKELGRVGNWSLCHENDYYFFATDDERASSWGVPVSQMGTLDEVITTLQEWIEIDRDIPSQIAWEKEFLAILEKEQARIVEKAMAKYEVKHQTREPSREDDDGLGER